MKTNIILSTLLLVGMSLSASEVVSDDTFTVLNIIPSSQGKEEIAAQDCIEYAERTGYEHCLYSMTLHPQGKPAMKTVDAAVASYRRWAKFLEGTKVRPGILLQAIVGHWTQDLAEKDVESWQRQINIHGSVTRFCPFDPKYQQYIFDVGRKLAECKPSVILSDDDVRAFSPHAECFCPLHTAEYNRRTGRNLSQDEFRALIAAAKVDSLEHQAFVELQRDTVLIVCGKIREGIDSVDPSIPSGVCEPGWHWARRYIPDYARKMAGPNHRAFARLANGCYYEHAAKTQNGVVTLNTLAEIERLKDSGLILLDEADTWPQNLWSKSAIAYHAKLVVAAFVGLKGAKAWLVNCHRGKHPITRHYTDVMAEHRGFYSALSAASRGSVPSGVLVPCHPEFPSSPVIEGHGEPAFDDISEQKLTTWFGIPFAPTFDFTREGIYIISGDKAVSRFDDGQLKAMLSRKALVDGPAAIAIIKRGLGEYLGVELRNDEPLFTGDYDEMNQQFMSYPKRMKPPLFRVLPNAKVLSSLIWRESAYVKDFERVCPSSVLYKNALGGMVVTTAFDPYMHNAYACTEVRQDFLYGLLDAVNGKIFEGICANCQNTIALTRQAKDGALLVLVQNLNSDADDAVRIRRGSAPNSVEEMDVHGIWKQVDFAFKDNVVTIPGKWSYYETKILRLR